MATAVPINVDLAILMISLPQVLSLAAATLSSPKTRQTLCGTLAFAALPGGVVLKTTYVPI